MLNLPIQPRYILPPIILLLFSTIFAAFDLNNLLEFNRSLIDEGELWRIFLANLFMLIGLIWD